MDKNQIPKIVHYCWFGGKEKPDNVKKCIESWKSKLHDYTFMEWNEKNFDINYNQYTKDAYETKKYAFVSDVARIQALYEYGGLYFDTDVEVLKNFDDILKHACVLGFEEKEYVATSFMATKPQHPLIKEFINRYENLSFYDETGNMAEGTNVEKFTKILEKRGLIREDKFQVLDTDIAVYPQEYFSPYDYINCISKRNENTYCEHKFFVSWLPWKVRIKKKIKGILVKIIGREKMDVVRKKIRSR